MSARTRFHAPEREDIDPLVWQRPPLREWGDAYPWLQAEGFPRIEILNDAWPAVSPWHFVEQTRELLEDGLHYEQRIAANGAIATRAGNWHDLFNALIWLRHTGVKRALNARQVGEIAHMGTKARSRAQCALTHFDEAGVIVTLRDPSLLTLWDAHDWHGLFWRERGAWREGRIRVQVFGHALLEHALSPRQLLAGKALVVLEPISSWTRKEVDVQIAAAIVGGYVLNDPQELRPLPLAGIPGWHHDGDAEEFYSSAACFRPLRPGRRYPAPLSVVVEPIIAASFE